MTTTPPGGRADGPTMGPPLPATGRLPLRRPLAARSPHEAHRAATALELLFDLTFVIAVATVTSELAHAVADGHAREAVVPFLQVFFAIWWAWMNFTWFASSSDNDDVPYRLLTLLQMAGVLTLAAGVPAAFADDDFAAVTAGYLVMRVGLVALWARARRDQPAGRATATRYVIGISVAELGWLARQLLDGAGLLPHRGALPVFLALVVFELCVPPWAERPRATTWHPHHIAERYGLFAIILLGEGVLAASTGVRELLADGAANGPLVAIAAAGLALVFALWWLYFDTSCGEGLAARRGRSYVWGYSHYGVFASLAALGAGLDVAVEAAARPGHTSAVAAAFAVALPVAAFLGLRWVVHGTVATGGLRRPVRTAVAVIAVLLAPAAAPALGPAGVIAIVAAICWSVVADLLLRG